MINRLVARLKSTKRWKLLNKQAKRPHTQKIYMIAAATVLFLTTVFWSVIGSIIHSQNADQLVDPYLFSDSKTFQGAQFPGAHTFLLKWPLFYVIKLAHFNQAAYSLMTVLLAVTTVGALAYVLYRIDKRPMYFSTTCLALASVLMLVPVQPYAGALLPVSFAMLATRNLEYVVYIVCLVGFIKASQIRTKLYGATILLLSILIASDKLFFTFSVGGALLMIVSYALANNWGYTRIATRWLLGTLLAALVSALFLGLLNSLHVTTIVGSTANNPYGFTTSLHNGLLGLFYAINSVLTNFGANPAYDAVELMQIPTKLAQHAISLSLLPYILNVCITVIAIGSIYKVVQSSLRKRKSRPIRVPMNYSLTIMLLSSTIVAFGIFVGANHYYPVDARYLTISLLAGFIALSTYFKKQKLQPIVLLLMGCTLLVGIIFAIPAVLSSNTESQTAQLESSTRNKTIMQALQRHRVSTAVGDYWRVLPIKQANPSLHIVPLASCIDPRTTLTSSVWNARLKSGSLAYVLSLDKGLTDFPQCSLEQVTKAFGQPNSTLLIAGSLDNPKEILLFYDQGFQQSKVAGPVQITAAPIALSDLQDGACYTPTVMNIVAHEDDDLLFLSPDLLHSVKAGGCVRTIYLTAGDGGFGSFYWTSRQQGSEAAYSSMLGTKDPWVHQVIKLGNGRYITIANPRGNPRISLVYFNLPDGNLTGDGFSKSGNVSLSKLRDGKIASLTSVDGQSKFTTDQLTSSLSDLMHEFQPAELRTQTDSEAIEFTDHSDHVATRWFADKSRNIYETRQYNGAIKIPTTYYLGYPGREQPSNVADEDLLQKELAFLTYAQFDGGVCRSKEQCESTPTYAAYLPRQYKQ